MKTTLSVLLILALSASARAQAPEEGAKLIDRFGDIQVSDMLARPDNFSNELRSAPGSKAYVVAYIVPNDFPGWPLRRANWARGYLVNGREHDEASVEVVNGGYHDDVTYEFWLVPPGAPLPKPSPGVSPAGRTKW